MAIIRANNNTLSSVTALPTAISTGSNIIEVISSICDGRSITVPSGTYTMPNVTAQQDMTSSYADLTGSSFTYTPPSDATKVIYHFQAMFCRSDDNPIAHCKFFVDSDEATAYRKSVRSYHARILMDFKYLIDCNASSNDTATAKFTSWTSNKTMKMQAREYSGTYESAFHDIGSWDGGGESGSGAGGTYTQPFLTIMALKDS